MDELVERIVRIRNDIAHGRQVYREDLIWPVPQFFPLNPDAFGYTMPVKVLAARAIGRIVGIDAWDSEWHDLVGSLHPTTVELREFIVKRRFEEISPREFLGGQIDNITPDSITSLYVERGIDKNQLAECMFRVLMARPPAGDLKYELTRAAAILADSRDVVLSTRCRKLITSWFKLKKNGLTNTYFRDIYSDLRYKGILLKWLPQYLNERRA
ncbi:MAG: hypothetical protein WAU88_14350 [Candidatus Zixiibacteriota bacterium]